MTTSIKIIKPDDMHCHLRDDVVLTNTMTQTAANFARAIVMPNLVPPLTSVAQIVAYKDKLLQAKPTHLNFRPLFTIYLVHSLNKSQIAEFSQHPDIFALKLYPQGVTTNSKKGVSKLVDIYPILSEMEKHDLPLLIHGESSKPDCDIFDREARFIEQELIPITTIFPNLRIVLEHISTQQARDFVLATGDNIAATITPQHLLYNRNDLLSGGIKPHRYCLPILKREQDRLALLEAATSGNPKFFLGTDSAPHAKHNKLSSCGCAGIYSAPVAMPIYTHIFEQANALDKLENFSSRFGADFYQLPYNKEHMTLVKKPWQVPESYAFGPNDVVVPLAAGETLTWQVQHDS